MIKYILPVLLFFSFYGCEAQVGENILSTSIVHKCHNDGNGTLTSFIVVQAIEVGNPNPVILGRFTSDDASYTPPAGTISFGTCTTDNNCLVSNEPDHDDIEGTSKTYPASSLHTLTFTVTEGTATATIKGKTTHYPQYFTEKYEAPNDCSYVSGAITIDATNGKVKVAIIR